MRMPGRVAFWLLVAVASMQLPLTATAGTRTRDPSAVAQAARPGRRAPRVFYTNSPPHAPNLVVVARAIALDTAMRAAGLNRVSHVAEVPVTPGTPGQLYTDSALEARTQQTRIDPGAQLVPVLREAWPEVGELGARTLAAQFSIETGAGRHCYNFNLGNHKAGGGEPHMYLRGVWEGVGQSELDRMRTDSAFGQLVREESVAELRRSGHLVPPGKIVVILDPPHPGARFRANATLELGVNRFAALHRRIGERDAMYLSALRAGDSRGVARILASPSVRYYTGNVDAYAQGMMNHRDIIDEGLGPPNL
jgi:hypothetical protein